MNKTKIEWVKNPDGTQGYSLNPIKGKCPMACKDSRGKIYCYNHKRIDRFHLDPVPRFLPEVLDAAEMEMIARKHPMGIFLCSTFEWLWNDEWALEVYGLIKAWEMCPDVRFYLLTKQPQHLVKWSPFPENCWVGVTVTTNGDMTNALTRLTNIQAGRRFISFEPLQGKIGFNDHMSIEGVIDWVIIGQQTPVRKATMPKMEWIQEIVNACDKAGIPVFLKDNLNSCAISDYPKLLDKNGNLRQEFPK